MKIDGLSKQRLQRKISPEVCSDICSGIRSGIRSGAELLQHILGAERVYIFTLASDKKKAPTLLSGLFRVSKYLSVLICNEMKNLHNTSYFTIYENRSRAQILIYSEMDRNHSHM